MQLKQRSAITAPRTALVGAVGAALLLARIGSAAADAAPSVTVGAGVITNFYSCDHSCIYSSGSVNTSAGDTSVNGFELDSIRLYLNGAVTDQIKMTFNTEYDGSGDNKVEVLDAIARFEFSPMFNIWAGRFLPPSDRANLYGPYYANDWSPFADGVADFYPSIFAGRDNGVAYWGDFGMLKVQAGLFDGETLSSAVKDSSKLLVAGRVMVDLWDKEAGYYLNGTYYGDKDVLAFGLAAQNQDSKTTFSLDGLMEKKLGDAGALSIEAEYSKDNGLTAFDHSDGWYGLVSYLFPQVIGIGKFQVLGKYSEKTWDYLAPVEDETDGNPSYKVKTTEINLNYIIKEFNARVGIYYLNQKVDLSSESTPNEFGVKLQLQM